MYVRCVTCAFTEPLGSVQTSKAMSPPRLISGFVMICREKIRTASECLRRGTVHLRRVSGRASGHELLTLRWETSTCLGRRSHFKA